MLATLIDDTHKITLIADSGIQFLDFGLRLTDASLRRQFVRQTANGPLLRLEQDVSGKFLLHGTSGTPPEVVRPESDIALLDSLTLLNNCWLPLPILRYSGQRRFSPGAENWARIHVSQLDKADAQGHTHRLTLALDTRLVSLADGGERLGLAHSDAENGVTFALAWQNYELADFLDLTWVDGWLRESFSERADRPEPALHQALREFEYQAHYLNLLELLGQQLNLTEISVQAMGAQNPAINVDLILDVGNSHTCGILVEEHQDQRSGLQQASELQLRDLSQPWRVWNELFDSRLEFCEARFGKNHFSLESGREQAFMWPSLTRTGSEASRLALQRAGLEGSSGISSPRRYLWDEAHYQPGWRFNRSSGHEPQAIAAPFLTLMNDQGQPLNTLEPDEKLPVFSAHYSRSSLMTFMLCELLAQALMQMNSVMQRQRMPQSHAPRQLRHIILTLPSAMPKPEREIFRQRMHEALGLVWKAEGWHPADLPFNAAHFAQATRPVPDVQMEWDEATCGQMVWLYNETQVNYAGNAGEFFAATERPDRQYGADESPGKQLRIASIDIGGGTTDLAITHYRLDDAQGNQAKITPRLLFREGFKVAGDDIQLDVIQLWILPALQQSLLHIGLPQPGELLQKLFGHDNRLDGLGTLRQQTTLQLFIPLAQAILARYECWNPLENHAEVSATFGELLDTAPSDLVLGFVTDEVTRQLGAEHRFDLMNVPLVVKMNQLHQEFMQQRMAIIPALRAMCEVVSFYQCDILLLTGRPSRFPGIQALVRHLQPLPGNRILGLEGYHTSEWYPFSKQGRIDNPKSTAAVGAMLCLLALELRLNSFWFRAGDFEPYSTIRYLGILDESATLSEQNTCYHALDFDDAQHQLDPQASLTVNGSVCLGFRQLENDRWPASPLYSLTINDAALARKVAGVSTLQVKLVLADEVPAYGAQHLVIREARLSDGSPVPLQHLSLNLNTLSASGNAGAQYWIDSGSVWRKS
ncbi:virulence factor SrfB [Pantoea sp. A4]|uniref:virulence factor SrfB n=1 Tax=Pantoea sp. A4 TaxID=1225184 RepID=UPI00037B6A41|nr:virulence factor SrfB [Pantoea sp. A4]